MTTAASPSTNVLVIDDAVETRDRLCALLVDQTPAHVEGCPAGRRDALARFAELAPACVVIDVPTHDLAGFELVAALRRRSRTLLLIVLTNHATEEFRQRSLAAGANHFLAKSTEFERVAELVRTLGVRP